MKERQSRERSAPPLMEMEGRETQRRDQNLIKREMMPEQTIKILTCQYM
jgi:hypothetical protein